MTAHFDIAVIGAGIAGSSVAARLAQNGKSVILLEMERQPGYHTTGRSAAIFSPTYGPAPIRALTRASEAFFQTPPAGFCATPLISPRNVLMIARTDQQGALDALLAEVEQQDTVSLLDQQALEEMNPLIRPGYATAAMLEVGGYDIDVSALHQGYLRQFKSEGGQILTQAEVSAMAREQSQWLIVAGQNELSADIVVNAAGAWADEVGQLAGAENIGLTPKRRTAIMIPAPDHPGLTTLPLTVDIEEQFYLKPDAGRLLISPADETPAPPGDAQPEELDVAICVDRIETAFDLNVRRIESKWAGLRSFVADKSPVAGFSNKVEGFYWLAGQGGYGIQSCPALADFAASKILGSRPPQYILECGLVTDTLSPRRLQNGETG